MCIKANLQHGDIVRDTVSGNVAPVESCRFNIYGEMEVKLMVPCGKDPKYEGQKVAIWREIEKVVLQDVNPDADTRYEYEFNTEFIGRTYNIKRNLGFFPDTVFLAIAMERPAYGRTNIYLLSNTDNTNYIIMPLELLEAPNMLDQHNLGQCVDYVVIEDVATLRQVYQANYDRMKDYIHSQPDPKAACHKLFKDICERHAVPPRLRKLCVPDGPSLHERNLLHPSNNDLRKEFGRNSNLYQNSTGVKAETYPFNKGARDVFAQRLAMWNSNVNQSTQFPTQWPMLPTPTCPEDLQKAWDVYYQHLLRHIQHNEGPIDMQQAYAIMCVNLDVPHSLSAQFIPQWNTLVRIAKSECEQPSYRPTDGISLQAAWDKWYRELRAVNIDATDADILAHYNKMCLALYVDPKLCSKFRPAHSQLVPVNNGGKPDESWRETFWQDYQNKVTKQAIDTIRLHKAWSDYYWKHIGMHDNIHDPMDFDSSQCYEANQLMWQRFCKKNNVPDNIRVQFAPVKGRIFDSQFDDYKVEAPVAIPHQGPGVVPEGVPLF